MTGSFVLQKLLFCFSICCRSGFFGYFFFGFRDIGDGSRNDWLGFVMRCCRYTFRKFQIGKVNSLSDIQIGQIDFDEGRQVGRKA